MIVLQAPEYVVSAVLCALPAIGSQSGFAFARWVRDNYPTIEIALAETLDAAAEFCEQGPRLASLFDRLQQTHAEDVSLLLTGPPGTGKTALAHHLARLLDRPLLEKRGSDLLSPYVGRTEAAIAAAFAEARRQGAVLLFDELDSILFDRSTARTSWEVTQVNELLTWLDRHPLPVVAATNYGSIRLRFGDSCSRLICRHLQATARGALTSASSAARRRAILEASLD